MSAVADILAKFSSCKSMPLLKYLKGFLIPIIKPMILIRWVDGSAGVEEWAGVGWE